MAISVAPIRPAAVTSTPISITKRGPCRSISRPMIGLSTADTRKPKEKAPAASPRSQPNSSTIGGNISEKAVRADTPRATVTKPTAMITHPKKNGRRPARRFMVCCCIDMADGTTPAATAGQFRGR